MPKETAELKIEGGEPGEHSVRVDVLVRMLNGLPVDLSPLVFGGIDIGQRHLTARPELRFTPHLDEDSQQLYVVEDATLDLCVYAPTREELADEIAAHLVFAWDEYAQADPHTLTPKAQELRDALRARFQEGE